MGNSWNARYNQATVSPGLIAAYEQIYQQGAAEGIGFYNSASDEGAGPLNRPAVSYPSSDPWVTGVGGTSLAVGPGGRYEWETGWEDHQAHLAAGNKSWADPPGPFFAGTGGGPSDLFRQPAYQREVVPPSLSHPHGSAAAMRVVPDIAADASSGTGVAVGVTVSLGSGQPAEYHEFAFAGTSVAVQLIAGMQADAQQAPEVPTGFANPEIYARYGTSDFHDVTDTPSGPGTRLDTAGPAGTQLPGTPTTPYLITFGLDQTLHAGPGYDDTTGVGTPAAAYFKSFR